ncbi:MAG: RidA family protein [Bacteroidetes bacterium]|nr:RidA family protein [Bacteroidota bacterium]MBU1371856.1 RidA family protein [Bacteroidota bacterium]MBU1483259.1 RidA family protein [Bacteroidota bacterium]MBU1760943.1 RidA family protein [Bacteroidota bacterium]MBU2268840.1 RidA family protein [Bacteroidota bacterium]
MKKIIQTVDAPMPIGPYSQAILINGILYASGQIAIDPKTGEIVDKSIEDETHQVMKNIKAVLEAAEMSFTNVVKTSIFLSDMDYFVKVNETYGKYFDGDYPARETIAVKTLPKNVNVEISVTAII